MSGSLPDRADLVAPHPHRVELSGRLRSLAFPQRCANCGAATAERLHIRKVFSRSAGRLRRMSASTYPGYRIDSADVPYCPACIARDARERESVASRWRARLPSFVLQSVPALPCLGFAVFLLRTTGAPMHAGDAADGFEHALVLLFGGSGLALIARALWETRRYMVPNQTSITVAFDFGPDVSDLLDPGERRIYAMRDAAFAEAFMALNRERVWLPDPAADRAERLVWIGCAVFVALGAIAALLLNR